ncbi:SLAM family member 5 [Aplochiton taeniatus]
MVGGGTVAGEPVRQITGYVGESVTLPSGANVSGGISEIEWSILSNSTWIATYRGGMAKVARFWRYEGRLRLNENTADLEIRNLAPEDATEYTVEFYYTEREHQGKGKVQLTILQRPRKPVIHEQMSFLKGDDCMMVLRCVSPEEASILSWGSDISAKLWTTGLQNNTSVLWATFDLSRDVTFTCTASNGVDNATHSLTWGCHGKFDGDGHDILRLFQVAYAVDVTAILRTP